MSLRAIPLATERGHLKPNNSINNQCNIISVCIRHLHGAQELRAPEKGALVLIFETRSFGNLLSGIGKGTPFRGGNIKQLKPKSEPLPADGLTSAPPDAEGRSDESTQGWSERKGCVFCLTVWKKNTTISSSLQFLGCWNDPSAKSV